MERYIRKSNYETAHFDGEWIVLNTDNYTLTKMNETGGFCWSLLSDSHSVETLSEAFFKHFDTDSHFVKEDIRAFLEDLFKCGLIRSVV